MSKWSFILVKEFLMTPMAASTSDGPDRMNVTRQDDENYQRLLDALDRMEAIESVKLGLESMKRNGGKPAEEFFNEFFIEKGISERTSDAFSGRPCPSNSGS